MPIPPREDYHTRTEGIKGRKVRVALYDESTGKFFGNSVYINASWREADEDKWKFNKVSEIGTNPIMFRTSDQDLLDNDKINIVFELVIEMKFADGQTDFTCGWCSVSLKKLLEKPKTLNLEIKGGAPDVEDQIQKQDFKQNMGIFKKIRRGRISSQLSINCNYYDKMPNYTKWDLDLQPQTCFFNSRLLLMLTGYRLYLANKLLEDHSMNFHKPDGDHIFVTLPKILNNPDVLENFIDTWGNVIEK